MSRSFAIVAALAAAVALPAFAQVGSPQSAAVPPGARLPDGAQPGAPRPAAPAPERVRSPEEIAIQQQGQAFGERMRALAAEIGTLQARTDLDAAAKSTAMDAAVARYAPDAEALAGRVEAFMRTQGPEAAAQATTVAGTIRGVPQQVRAGVVSAAERQAAAPAPAAPAPAAPTTPST